MGSPEPIRLGPFTGGMNTYSDPSLIADNQLVDCLNMELDLDGSLVCRPIIRRSTAPHGGNNWVSNRIKVIGQGVWDTGTITEVLFGSNTEGLWYLEDPTTGGQWHKILSAGAFEMRDAVQCGRVVAFIPATAGKGGYWSPLTDWIADANIPPGNAAVFFKQRLWVVPGPNPVVANDDSRLYYSQPIVGAISSSNKFTWTDPETSLSNFVDISAGDGQALMDICVYLDQLLLFKTDSTYVLAYETSIDQGVVRCISTQVGATMRVCVAQWEDMVYVFHQGRVYEIKNYEFTQINENVVFVIDGTVPAGKTRANNAFVCVVEDRLLVRFYNNVYMYGLQTQTWSRWTSPHDSLQNFGYLRPFPTDSLRDKPIYYYGGSVIADDTDVFEWVEGRSVNNFETYDGTTRLSIDCSVTTKTLDMDDPQNFKRLGWWGIDVVSKGNVKASAVPVLIHWSSTWDSISTLTWDELLTWDHLTDVGPHEDTTAHDTTLPERKFIKLNKSLRFRKIYFYVLMKSDGSTQDGPSRLYVIVPWIGIKETVVKQVS